MLKQAIWSRSRPQTWVALTTPSRPFSTVRPTTCNAYQGGTCNETDRSAQVCVQAAMATQPEQVLAKPGMGVDEGYMIVYNEMARILAYEKAQQ